MSFRNRFLRNLPAVDRLLSEESLRDWAGKIPYKLLLEAAQEIIESYRERIMSSGSEKELENMKIEPAVLAGEAALLAETRFGSSLRPVINATGTVLHTNLGRAPLSDSAVKAVAGVAGSYCNLELSLETGQRDSRLAHVESLLCELTGAEASLVVNNNAAAVFLVLNTLANNREVIVSRGQLVEIGGSFRIPDVMSASGATLVEVGTTNKCYLSDYENAITDNTAVLLKVHTSNYRIMGFTEEVSGGELADLGRQAGLPVIEDLGSGMLSDLSGYGLPPEPTVRACLREGVSLVTFSGDKLLGGPQAGIITGDAGLIKRIKSNQLLRALRVDKFTVAALEATLRIYRDKEKAFSDIPVLRMLTSEKQELKHRALLLLRRLRNRVDAGEFKINEDKSAVGGGALPLAELPTFIISYKPPENISLTELAGELRLGEPSLIVRLQNDCLLLDLRTILPGQDKAVAGAMEMALGNLFDRLTE